MEPSPRDVDEFVANVQPDRRRRDAELLLPLFARATGENPVLWGSIIGFGTYHYVYPSGREGDTPIAGFSPRKASTTIYLADGVAPHQSALDRLGPHTTGVGCVYVKDATAIDLAVLEEIVTASARAVAAGALDRRDGS